MRWDWTVWLLVALLAADAFGRHNVSVIRKQVSFEEEHTVVVDVATEYILDFIPNEEESQWPARLWVSTDGGDLARPLLLTYRQRTGAGTWQLPWPDEPRPPHKQPQLRYELERTLCPDDCDVTDCASAGEARGVFSLHAAAASAAPRHVRVRARPARDWRLHYQRPQQTTLSAVSPSVNYYQFPPEQQRVRLVVASPDDVCATIAVLPTLCPIAQTLQDIGGSSVRMTVMRSGAAQLTRERFPGGFYVVAVAHPTPAPCAEQPEPADDWLVAELLYGQPPPATATAAAIKTITIDTQPALTRSQYAVATSVTLGLCLAVYAGFGLLVAAQRWRPFGRLVEPRAVLANEADRGESSPDAADVTSPAHSRRRRDSNATFDSSDNSDTDSDTDRDVTTPSSRASARDVTAPASPTVAVTESDDAPSDVTRGDVTGGDVTPTVAAHQIDARVTSQNQSANGVVGANGVNAERAVFGLPARLHVAALARRRARVLRARTDRYLTTLLTVAVFYALPVLQFVFSFQIFLNVSGSLDTCYYNFLCAHPAGMLSDFNHVFSNVGYLLLGALFMLQLRRRQARRRTQPRSEGYGIPPHYGLLSSLGAGMMVVALLSASYHVCPNRLNFQFDTSFMYVLGVLSMVKIYQSRHPDVNARAHATFGVLAVLIALVVWGVLGGGALFWGVFTVLHVFTFLLLSLRIYYLGQFRFEKESLQQAARQWRGGGGAEGGASGGAGGGGGALRALRPLYTARLVLLLIANAVNWAFALYGLFTQSADFASHLLYVVLGNALLYMCFYVSMKLLHGERPRWYSWALTAGAAAAWAGALYAFTAGATSWAASPAASRHRNHACLALHFYDTHDLWHLLSALALYLSFNAMLTWDDGLAAVPRDRIAVF